MSKHVALILAAAVTALPVARAAAEDTLTVVSWGGAYQESQRKAFMQPFSKKYDVKVLEDEWNGEVAKLKGMVETKAVSIDVIDVEASQALQGCDEGWLEKIDYSTVGGKDKYVEGSTMECGIGTIVFGTIYAYNADKFPNGGPQTAADFWDTKKFPGPRALRKAPKTTLEFALIADGVPATDVYKVLGTKEGVDRAFKKLDALKPDVKVWWTAGAQPPQLMADGEVVMSTAWNGRIQTAIDDLHKNFKIVWDGQGQDFDLWAIPKGSPHLAEAKKFIAFTETPDVLAEQTKYISYGPVRTDAVAKVDPAILPKLPTAPQNSKNAYAVSAQFWADHDEELTERFNKWLAQ
jgi:putative spermidine/putrescine transport system substrate-binding protein